MCAPRAVSTSSSVARVGLRPSESRTRLEPGKSAAAQRKNAAEEMIAGDGGFDGVERLRAGDGDGVERARERCAEGAEGELAVVAGADRFADGGGSAVCRAGEERSVLTCALGTGVV